MFRKLCLFAAAAAVAFSAAGCASLYRYKDNSFRSVRMTPSVRGIGAQVADLEVSGKKSVGRAAGRSADKDDLEKSAVWDALKPSGAEKIYADVLVGANFFYQYANYDLTVTVVGYPARYKNIRPKETGAVIDEPARAQEPEAADEPPLAPSAPPAVQPAMRPPNVPPSAQPPVQPSARQLPAPAVPSPAPLLPAPAPLLPPGAGASTQELQGE